MTRRCLAGLWLVLALGALPAGSQAARDDVDLISRASGVAGVKGNGDSGKPELSGDGRFVAFLSAATNVHPDDGDGILDVFVRDLQTGTTTLVSRASGAVGATANGHAYEVAISGDGRYVAFDSQATSLDPDDADTGGDIYVRDLQTDTTTLASRAPGGAKANDESDRPALSADGRLVAFTSHATNLHPDDPDGVLDVFVRDLQTHANTLVSRATGADGAKCNEHCEAPAISADGRFVAFESRASNLDPADGDNVFDVMVRDLQTSTTTLVSRASGVGGAKSDGESFWPAISSDGRFVAFHSTGSNLDPADRDPMNDVYVRDLQTGTTTLVSRAGGATGAKGDGESDSPAISRDGRYVAFASTASNLDPSDSDSTVDVFVRDLETHTTTLVSRAAGESGAKGNADSFFAALSGDGRFAAFTSFASNLHPEDGDASADVFRRQLSGDQRPAAPEDAYPTAQHTPPPPAAPAAKPLCQGRAATIVGTAARDVLRGTPKADVIVALGGNDLVRGVGGNDRVCAGAGNDRVEGGAGADRLEGAAGNDRLLGGRGSDRLFGGLGKDVMRGGPGRDRTNGGPGRDRSSP
jgi:Tol biopolymer transport system component